jgi:hypothetical protein
LAAGRRQRDGHGAEHVALKQECDALRLLLNQIRFYAPKVPDEARA